MNWEEIKEIIESEGGKFIIVENGKPVMVVTGFKDYKDRLGAQKIFNIEKVSFSKKLKEKPLPKELIEEELKIEDLPF